MWPGVANVDNLGEFGVDDVVSIVTSEGVTFAVGAMAMSYHDLKELDKLEGVAAYILTHNED